MTKVLTQNYSRFTLGVLFFLIFSLIALLLGTWVFPGIYNNLVFFIAFMIYCLYVFYPRTNSSISNTRRASFGAGIIFVLSGIATIVAIIIDRNSQGQGNVVLAFLGFPNIFICFTLGIIFTIGAKIKPNEILK